MTAEWIMTGWQVAVPGIEHYVVLRAGASETHGIAVIGNNRIGFVPATFDANGILEWFGEFFRTFAEAMDAFPAGEPYAYC
ncbi:MAG TPA: hypothetical protein VNQ76_17220 [Planctomicrobium sp.]|nr:hypothetical protein [Planctomicrobium sp.]